VVLAHILDRPALDGWSSVGIGLVLVGMAIFLMIETHGLLIGEAADPEVVAAIQEVVGAEAGVNTVNEVLTQHMGPSDILVNVSLDMADDLSAGEVERVSARLDRDLKARVPNVTRVFIEAQARAASVPAMGRVAAEATAG
jgi:divalent metal cation (Fe/Co/Zn/Cd) transporter